MSDLESGSMLNRKEFDYTMMSTFLNCRRMYDFRINRGLVGKVPMTAPAFGHGIHAALDEWYESKDVAKAIEVFKEDFKEDVEVDNKRTYVMGEWIIKNYDQQYRDQPWRLVASEMEFELPLPNGNIFVGRIDKVIEWSGVLWVVDHKTSSSLGASFFKTAEPNLQFTGYTWAAKQRGHDVKGIILDAILVAKGLLPGSSKNYNLTPLARYDVYRSQEHLDEWYEVVDMIQKDIRRCEEANQWCPNFDACTYYGECPYRKICKEDKDVRERIIESDYETDFWSPIKEKVDDNSNKKT